MLDNVRIKKIKFSFVLLILFMPALVYAEDLRVLFAMFDMENGDTELARRISIACSKEVIGLKAFRYISPTELVKIITGDKRIVVDKIADPEKEYSDKNIEYLKSISDEYKKDSFDNFFKMLESADILIGGSIKRNGPLIEVEMTMNCSKTERQFDVTVKSEDKHIEAEMRKKVRELLKRIARPVKIYADKLIDARESVVAYVVKSMDNADIIVEMNYTGDRPDPKAQEVKILPPEGINKIGVATYRVKSEEGKVIEIEFAFKREKLDSVKVYTEMPNPSIKTEQSETLTMKSASGYALKFEFAWNKGGMVNVKLYPALNPFGDYEE